ncbi:MAG: serine hydrolase [Spirochaetaceae bacterium]|nr:serine hydrolase [Spirochaetaceae bacterium]
MSYCRTHVVILLISCFFISSTCSRLEFSQDYWPTENWRRSTPEQQGMDSEKLALMLEYVEKEKIPIDSIHIIRNGYLILDTYIHPFRSEDRHIIHSCTKSIVSILIGIAIDKDYINDVNQPVLDFYTYYNFRDLTDDKQNLTLRHLLTMTTSLDSRDSYLYRWDGLKKMIQTYDWTSYILNLPMVSAPGDRFEYSNMSSFLLTSILSRSTGQSPLDFAAENLFVPLGISDIQWPVSPDGINIGWGEMRIKPLDMAKIGLLVLNKGKWAEKQIVSSAYLKDSTKVQVETNTLQKNYGFQWWISDENQFMAVGFSGQYLIINRKENLIAVITSSLSEEKIQIPENLFNSFVLNSLGKETVLPENGLSFQKLVQLEERLSNPATTPIGEFPVTAQAISSNKYKLTINNKSIDKIQFLFGNRTAEVHVYYGENPEIYPIGLNGKFLLNENEDMAVKGAWMSENRFRFIMMEQGGSLRTKVVAEFFDDRIVLDIKNNTGESSLLKGRIE